MSDYLKRVLSHHRVQALLLMSIAIAISLSLITYSSSDPSFNLVTDKYPTNWLKGFGSHLADLLYQLFGLAAFIFPICSIFWASRLYKRGRVNWLPIKVIMMLTASIALAMWSAKFKLKALPASNGGAVGSLLQPLITPYGLQADLILISLALILFIGCLGIEFGTYINFMAYFQRVFAKKYSLPNVSIKLTKPAINMPVKRAPVFIQDEVREEIIEDKAISGLSNFKPAKYSVPTTSKSFNTSISTELPSIELLKKVDRQNIKMETQQELKTNAEHLLSVLSDFGVKGQVAEVRQGPVVTLYEFEPAAGTKSSRVIGLSDDIARSLSAISTRIAVVPGRNALGIELPNKQREFFCLRELIETPEYQDPSILLPLILGKDLAGRPYIADLAKMPHLLVAGTTGSGKSVAINAMIVSLLYRYTPAQCRLIMIDPKMLELSAYDGIPHLLTPVVTEPGKAVVALKWAVKEMENRYRLMSNVGVRNIAGYNAKIQEAAISGKNLERTVQTGFDHETGKPIYESVPISMENLPFIVVIVDEMADLMLVAGKDIETSIQRLAQMARAAGIHIIMATQRPSVDVITGVIKANFPSRISFKVTSKIDSRTILGEQGSEQLLGMGDMLYMGNTSRITRVHGPFVDDREVEKITQFLRSTGVPEYVSAVIEAPDNEEMVEDLGEGSDDETIYKRAVQIVKLERKVSISYIQRCLRIGYNRAASAIERMERDGIISVPSHTGKREILLPED